MLPSSHRSLPPTNVSRAWHAQNNWDGKNWADREGLCLHFPALPLWVMPQAEMLSSLGGTLSLFLFPLGHPVRTQAGWAAQSSSSMSKLKVL